MKNRKPLFIIIILCLSFFLLANYSFAQAPFEPPQNIQLKTQDDYKKYEPQIVEAAKWLEQTDLDKEINKRKLVNTFLLQWVSGSATVNVGIDEDIQKLFENNTQLLSIYIASYARNIIENTTTFTKMSATKAALTAVINTYKKGIGLKKNRGLNKLARMSDSELDNYISTNFDKDGPSVITNPHH